MSSKDLLANDESGVTRWSYEELNTVTEISREAGLPIHAHFGPMWALPIPDAELSAPAGVEAMAPGDVLAPAR